MKANNENKLKFIKIFQCLQGIAITLIILSFLPFCKIEVNQGKKNNDDDKVKLLTGLLGIVQANMTGANKTCGIPRDSSTLFWYQVTYGAPGPSTGNAPWDWGSCHPVYSVTTGTSFSEEITISNQIISLLGSYAAGIAGGTYTDGTGINFLSSTLTDKSTTISSAWTYDALGRVSKKTRTAMKRIEPGTTYTSYVASTERNPITGCPAVQTTDGPKTVDVIETTSYTYNADGSVQEDLKYECDGVQAKGPGFVQRKIYRYSNGVYTSVELYANADFAVSYDANGAANITKLFTTTLSANPFAKVEFAYTPTSITDIKVTITQSGYYIQKKDSAVSNPKETSYSVLTDVVGKTVFELNTSGGKLLSAKGTLTCNAKPVTSDALTSLSPQVFQSRNYCTSAKSLITNSSSTEYTSTQASNDTQSWEYEMKYDSYRSNYLTSVLETKTSKTAYSSNYYEIKTKKSYYWVYDDKGRILNDNTYFYNYDSYGLQSYFEPGKPIKEFYVR